MSDIVLLSHQADEIRVHPLVDALVEDRQDIAWLRVGNARSAADRSIAADVEASRCVVLVWSQSSADAAAKRFHRLAKQAVAQGNAICVLIDTVTMPPDIGACTIYDMRGWRGAPQRWRKWLGGNLYMRDLVTGAKYKVAGRDPPPPGAPRQMLIRHALVLIPAIFAPLAVLATLLGFWGGLGFADGPSAAETRVWEAVDKNDCSQLKKFRLGNAVSYFAPHAQARLDGAVRTTKTIWEPVDRTQPFLVPELLADPKPDRASAIGDVRARAQTTARSICIGLAEAGRAKLDGSEFGSLSESCTGSNAGTVCSAESKAICHLSEPRDVEVVTCSAN